MEQRISFLTLGVADLDRSKAFYEALGWTASAYGAGAGVVFFQLNGMVLGLFPHGDLAADAGLEPSAVTGFRGVTISYNTRSEAEADTIVGQALAAGGTLLKAGNRASWGGYVAYFADPDGHAWEVCHNPQTTLGEDGAIRLPT